MIDNSKRAERNSLACFFIAKFFFVFTAMFSKFWAQSQLLYVASIPLALAMLFAILSYWRCFLVRKQAEESIDRERVKSDYKQDDLFEDQNDAMRMSETALKQFDKWIISVIAILIGLSIPLTCSRIFMKFSQLQDLGMENSGDNALGAAGLIFFMFIITLMYGSYVNGLSRESSNRWLRPTAQWLLLSAGIFFIALLVKSAHAISHRNPEFFTSDLGQLDVSISLIIIFVIAIFGLELLLNCIIEIYRPRKRDELRRPLYESRFLSLLTQPGGLAKNVAQSLDYQFGFKVSETWFYGILEKSILPFILLLALVVYMLDCFVIIKPNERGILITRGKKSDESRGPGYKWKLPRPFQYYKIYQLKKLHRVDVGFHEEDEDSAEHGPEGQPDDPSADTTGGRAILWTTKHHKDETRFLVAVKKAAKDTSTFVPVNFLSANLSIFYRIKEKELHHYAFNYKSPELILEQTCQQIIVNYMASHDLYEILGHGHLKTKQEISQRIIAAIDALSANPKTSLGIEIVNIILRDIHPPTEVAASFQGIISAETDKETTILKAHGAANQTINLATGHAYKIVAEAHAYKYKRSTESINQADRFNKQLTAYESAPEVFKARAETSMYLRLFKKQKFKKYINLSKRDIQLVYKDDDIRDDITDIELTPETE
ncbi:MAG: hypothetical protein HRT89_23815 [Lentisphaeria bacterium]|nr:SPFH domain-containing protein [Lentisphaeria bacterium]NQZ71086.1 hypothetical protein [Lentisphaeria bacterium]